MQKPITYLVGQVLICLGCSSSKLVSCEAPVRMRTLRVLYWKRAVLIVRLGHWRVTCINYKHTVSNQLHDPLAFQGLSEDLEITFARF